jgi:hypothetical protein
MVKHIVVSLGLVGGACSSEHRAPDAGANASDDSSIDAPPPRCDLTRPFGPPTPVPGINTAAEENGGWLSPDELRIYFAFGPSPIDPDARDLYMASRATVADAFGAPTKLSSASSTARDQQPSLTADELTLFFARDSTTNIYVSTRSDPQASFNTPVAVDSVNGSEVTIYDDSPWISADGLTLYFASTRTGNFNYELYQATRASPSAPFDTPSILAGLTSIGNDSMPVVRGDGLELFFASNREQVMYPEGYTNDIYRATRASLSEAFGAPSVVTELAAPTNEGPTWISPDGCTLVFTSSRAGAGGYDLWMTTRE